MAFFRNRPTLLIVSSGVLTAIGVAVSSCWFLVCVGLSLFFYSVWQASSLRRATLYGLLFGTLVSGGGVLWFFETLPLSWLAVPPGGTEYIFIGVVWLVALIALAIPFALVTPLFFLLRKNLFLIPLSALLFGIMEELRMWSFALIFSSGETVFGAHFSIPALGYALAENTYLLQLASIGGIAVLNVSVALIGGVLAFLLLQLKKEGPRKTYLELGVVLACCGVVVLLPLFLTYSEPTDTHKTPVALITTTTPAGVSKDPATILALIQKAINDTYAPTIITLPEGHGLANTISNPDARRAILDSLSPNREILLISSNKVLREGKEYRELMYESSTRGVVGTHTKMFLVPVGEYFPPVLQAIFSLTPAEALHGYRAYLGTGGKSGDTLSAATIHNTTVGSLMCSEMLSPSFYRRLVREKGANLFVTISNNSWFHGSAILHEKLIAVAKVHAVTNRTYFLVTSNDAPSFAIDPRGVLIAHSEWNKETVLFVDVLVRR